MNERSLFIIDRIVPYMKNLNHDQNIHNLVIEEGNKKAS